MDLLTGVLSPEQNCNFYKRNWKTFELLERFHYDMNLCCHRSPCISGIMGTVRISLLFLSCALSRRTLLRPSTAVLPLWAASQSCVWVSALWAALIWLSLIPSKWWGDKLGQQHETEVSLWAFGSHLMTVHYSAFVPTAASKQQPGQHNTECFPFI